MLDAATSCTKFDNFAIQRELRLHDLIVLLALSLAWLRLDDLIVQLTLSLAWLRHDQRCYESAEGQKDKHLSQKWLQKPAIQRELRFHDLIVRLALTLVLASS